MHKSENKQADNRKEKEKVDEISNKVENKGSGRGNEQKHNWSLSLGGQPSNYIGFQEMRNKGKGDRL